MEDGDDEHGRGNRPDHRQPGEGAGLDDPGPERAEDAEIEEHREVAERPGLEERVEAPTATPAAPMHSRTGPVIQANQSPRAMPAAKRTAKRPRPVGPRASRGRGPR